MSESLPNSSEKTERAFLRVVQFGSSLSLGGMAGFLYSIKEVNPHVRAEFGVGTVCAFVLMTGATWLFWRVLLNKHHLEGTTVADRRIRTVSLLCLSVVLVGGMVLATLRALHNLPHDRYLDVIEGTVMAFVVLGALGFVLWKIVRFLELDHQRQVEEDERADNE